MSEATVPTVSIQVRWMLQADLPEILAIERATFRNAWSEEKFEAFRRHPQRIGKVALDAQSSRILGYVMYELQPHQLVIQSLAVHPDHRHQRVATRLIATRLIVSLGTRSSLEKRRLLSATVNERNLGAQLFFRKQGFRAVRTVPDQKDSAYVFQYRLWAGQLQQEIQQHKLPIKPSIN